MKKIFENVAYQSTNLILSSYLWGTELNECREMEWKRKVSWNTK